MENRRKNLAEMEQEERKKITRTRTLVHYNPSGTEVDSEKSQFIEFELTRNKAKIEDLKNRIRQKDIAIHSMEHARRRVTECLISYSKGENPRLPVLGLYQGIIF